MDSVEMQMGNGEGSTMKKSKFVPMYKHVARREEGRSAFKIVIGTPSKS
jgi:hypothetical protein